MGSASTAGAKSFRIDLADPKKRLVHGRPNDPDPQILRDWQRATASGPIHTTEGNEQPASQPAPHPMHAVTALAGPRPRNPLPCRTS
jgi:hypothetical protein